MQSRLFALVATLACCVPGIAWADAHGDFADLERLVIGVIVLLVLGAIALVTLAVVLVRRHLRRRKSSPTPLPAARVYREG